MDEETIKIDDMAAHFAIAESAAYNEYYDMIEDLEVPVDISDHREIAEWILGNNYQAYLDM